VTVFVQKKRDSEEDRAWVKKKGNLGASKAGRKGKPEIREKG